MLTICDLTEIGICFFYLLVLDTGFACSIRANHVRTPSLSFSLFLFKKYILGV